MLGKTLVGHYKILEELGRGGFGYTFIAQDLHLPGYPKCVIKQLKPKDTHAFVWESARRLFDREAQTLYKLGKHSQIPSLLAHFEYESEFYLAQELIEGVVLSQEIKSGTQLSEAYVFLLLQEVLEVLEFVHQQGVIHRDIKPANLIKRSPDSKIVLIDFGAVKEVGLQTGGVQDNTSITVTIGSPGYMPDEQANGRPKFASDIYAIGMMCIHALTGISLSQMPQDPKTGEVVWRDRVPNISAELADFLDKMTRPHFSQRFENAMEALADFQKLPQPINAASTTIVPNNSDVATTEAESTIVSSKEDSITPILPIAELPTTIISSESQSEHQVIESSEATITIPKFISEQNILQGIEVPKQDDRSSTSIAKPPIDRQIKPQNSYLIIWISVIAVIASLAGYLIWQQSEVNRKLVMELESANSLKVAGKYQECINRVKGISTNGSDVRLQGLLQECQNGLIETESKSLLLEAKNLAADNKLEDALKTVTKINANSSVYADSLKLAEQWSSSLLDIATKKYQEEGKLQEAIALLQVIPKNVATGKLIEQLPAKWQSDWKVNENTLKSANNAIKESRWSDAIAESKKITTPYWQKQTEVIVQKANAALANVSVPVSTPESQPQLSADSQPIYESQQTYSRPVSKTEPQPAYIPPPSTPEPTKQPSQTSTSGKIDLPPVNTGGK